MENYDQSQSNSINSDDNDNSNVINLADYELKVDQISMNNDEVIFGGEEQISKEKTEEYNENEENPDDVNSESIENSEQSDCEEINSETFFIEYFRRKITNLQNIWQKMKMSESDSGEKINELIGQLKLVLNQFVNKEKEKLETYWQEKKVLEKEIETDLAEMANYIPLDQLAQLINSGKSPNIDRTEGNLSIEISNLKQLHQVLTDYQREYTSKVSYLQSTLKMLIKALDLDYNDYEHLLSTEQLTELNELEILIDKNLPIFQEKDSYCSAILARLSFIRNVLPSTLDQPFAQEYLIQTDEELKLNDKFVYTEPKISELNDFFQTMKMEFENQWNLIVSVHKQLDQLHPLFNNVPNINFDTIKLIENGKLDTNGNFEYYYSVNAKFPINLKLIYAEMVQEWNYLEKKKLENIAELIANVRSEYFELLDQCLINIADDDNELKCKAQFEFLFRKQFDNNLFELHRTNLEKLRQFHRKNVTLFSSLKNYNEIRKEFDFLDEQMKLVYRTRNRGGLMLKLSKEKNFCNQKIKKIHKEIQNLTENKDNGQFDDIIPLDIYYNYLL